MFLRAWAQRLVRRLRPASVRTNVAEVNRCVKPHALRSFCAHEVLHITAQKAIFGQKYFDESIPGGFRVGGNGISAC